MSDLYLEPLADRVLVKPDPVETVSEGGIIIAEDRKLQRAATHSGVLVSIGKFAWDSFGEPLANVGDRVMYVKYGGAEVEDPVTKEVYVVLNDTDITFKIKDKVDE